jgi:DNA-binding response OmpR family regulator
MERRRNLGNQMLKVLLVEDDPSMVSLLTTLLNLEGFMVKTPKNHNRASLLSAILEERPQIVLVDVNLAFGNGLDLVRAIRLEPKIKDMRILMSSGLDLQRECIQAGADGFILKPFMPDELINLIRSTVNNKYKTNKKKKGKQ